MNSSTAYVFDTLGTPHGCAALPGEDVAEHHCLRLRLACEAIRERDVGALREVTQGATPRLPNDTTEALREAIRRMDTLAREAQGAQNADFLQSDWCERAERAMDRVVRKSIEMRAVALLASDVRPFNRF